MWEYLEGWHGVTDKIEHNFIQVTVNYDVK